MPARTLPDHPSLEQLRKQAKVLRTERRERGEPLLLREAQSELAREYGFSTWAELKAHVEYEDVTARLKLAIDTDEAMLRAEPAKVHETYGDQRWTGAFFAAAANRTEVLEVLDRFRCSWRAKDDHTQRTPLHVAAERGNLEAVIWLLERGVTADVGQWTGETPLHAAIRAGAPAAILEALFTHGADIDALSAAGTPLAVAVRAGREEASQWLRAHGAREE